MRSKLLLVALLSALVACAPAYTKPNANGFLVTVGADSGWKGFVVASSAKITKWEATGFCRPQPTFAGPDHALACAVPNEVRLETKGQIEVREAPKP